MIPTMLAALAYFGPKSTSTTTLGIAARTAKAANPMAVTSPTVLGESLADADARAASGDKPRISYYHERPRQEHGDMARGRRSRVETRSGGREEVTSKEYVDPGQRGVPGERGDRQHGVAQGDPY